jgi:hypothetical protein
MDLLNVGAVILFGMLVLGWLFQPAREQQIVIIHETPHEVVRGGGCGMLLITVFLALLLAMLLFGGH